MYGGLDKRDRRILWLLSANARQPFSKIAREVRLSKEVVHYRVRRLLERGILCGTYTLVDPSALGYISARLFLKFQHTTPEIEQQIIDYYAKNVLTGWTVSRGGAYDFGAQFWGRSVGELYAVKSSILKKFRKYIYEANVGVYHKIHFFDRKYLGDRRAESLHTVICASAPQKLDDTDFRVLECISRNARASVVDVAKRTGESAAVVRHRLKKLEGHAIRGYLPVVDTGKLGLEWYKVSLVLDDYAVTEDIIRFLAAHPHVTNAYELLCGGGDVELELEVPSPRELESFLDALKEKFAGSIRYCDYFLWTKEHKTAFLPPYLKGDAGVPSTRAARLPRRARA